LTILTESVMCYFSKFMIIRFSGQPTGTFRAAVISFAGPPTVGDFCGKGAARR
jgi:hypothetical protein